MQPAARSKPVTVAAAQMASRPEAIEANLERAAECVANAKKGGACIVAFPEQFATGWDPASSAHLQEPGGQVIARLSTYARAAGIAILGSIRERCSQGPRNTCIMIDRFGRVRATYAKCHLFSPAGEDLAYVPGNEISLFELGGLTCGIAICYDLRFGALFRLYERAGADVVFVPAAWPAERVEHWTLLARTRALECGMYIVGINTTGNTPVSRYNGHSLVADPHGRVLAEAGSGEELLMADLDPSEVQEARKRSWVRRDERNTLYHSLNRQIGKDSRGTSGRQYP